MREIERDQPVITIINAPPTEGSILNGKRSIDVYSGIKTPALGPAVINGVLLGEGYQNVTTLDPRFNTRDSRFHAPEEKFTESDFRLMEQSDVIGISSMTRNREVSLRLIESIKSKNPNTLVIVGGPDATFKPELWLKGEKSADYVVRNEGEETIVELVHALKDRSSVENVEGISYRKDGEIVNNKKRALLTEEELSNVALPFFPENIRKNGDAHVVESKRGCPNRCEFCSVTGLYDGTYRLKDNKIVMNSIKAGKPGKSVFFVDDNFAHKSRLTETKQGMQEIIDAGLDDRNYFMQLDTVTVNIDPEFTSLAVKMGLLGVFVGIESYGASVLKGMHKAATADQNVSAIKTFKKFKVYTHGMEIIGSKNETRESIDTTKKYNRLLGINSIQVFPEIPILGSELAKAKKLLPAAERDTNLIDGHHVVTFAPEGFTCSELYQEMMDAYHDFYSLSNMKNAFSPLKDFLTDPRRALTITLMTIGARMYARNLLSKIENSEYTKNYVEYLKRVDREIYAEGKKFLNSKKD
jgi:radical SAM superfamily enzyme YgiQ (UPF0313 family)